MSKIILILLVTLFITGCATFEKRPEIIIKDGGVNASHIKEAKELIVNADGTAELK